MSSNCLVFAVRLYLRRRKSGHEGYIVLRRSRWGAFPHAMYGERRRSGGIRVVGYSPRSPEHRKTPPPLFDGAEHWGDDPRETE